MLDLKKVKKLSSEDIRDKAPSVFTEKGHSDTSKHYTHIPTYKVIEDMKQLNWDVVDVQQVGAYKESNRGFQKHLVVFQNDDLEITGTDGDTVHPRVLLTNSHDARNAFQFQAGLFRMICSNGLVVSDHNFSKLKIRHMGYDFSELKDTITEIVSQLPLTVESMNKFKATELNEQAKHEFALAAIGLRFNDDNALEFGVNVEELVKPTRKEDVGDDLWSVFNVVQEKLVDGEFDYSNGTKIRKARKIKNFKQDIKLNADLFALASEYVA